MATTPTPTDLDFDPACNCRRCGKCDQALGELTAAREELAKTRAELAKAQQLEAMAGRHAQQRDADLRDAEVTIQRLKTRLAEGDARWSRHMADEHPITADEPLYTDFSWGANGADQTAELSSDPDRPLFRLDVERLREFVGMAADTLDFLDECRLGKQLHKANPATTAEPADEDELVPHVEHISAATIAGMAAMSHVRNPDLYVPWDDEPAAS